MAAALARFPSRRALRSCSQPAFALTAIVTLAVGLAANAAIFALLDAIVLRPLTFRDIDRLVQVFGSAPKKDTFSDRIPRRRPPTSSTGSARRARPSRWPPAVVGRHHHRDPRARARPGVPREPGVLRRARRRRRRRGAASSPRKVTAGSQSRRRARPRRSGRASTRAIPPSSAAPSASTASPTPSSASRPDRFDYPDGRRRVDAARRSRPSSCDARDRRYLRVIGRLRDGRTVADLQAELATVSRRLAAEYPDTNRGWTVNVMPLAKRSSTSATGRFSASWQVSAMLLLLDRLRERREACCSCAAARVTRSWRCAWRSAPAAGASSASC